MGLDDRAADEETKPHAVALGGHERLEEAAGHPLVQAWASVGNGDLDVLLAEQSGGHVDPMWLAHRHRFDGVANEVDKHLLDLNPVRQGARRVRIEMELHIDPARATSCERC